MNRRSFIKFLGKATVVSGIAVATGLPEIDKAIDNPVDIEPYVRGCNSGSMHGGVYSEGIARWNGDAWGKLKSANSKIRQPYIDKDGVLHVIDSEFTSP